MAKRRSPVQSRGAVTCALAVVLLAVPLAARAGSSTDSAAQAPSSGTIAPDSTFARQPGNLSDKLDKSNGVIRPGEVDPRIDKTPPPTGSAAVIPPPGSPGGPQGIQPK